MSGNLGRFAEEEKERVSESRWPEAEKGMEKQEFVLPTSKAEGCFPKVGESVGIQGMSEAHES